MNTRAIMKRLRKQGFEPWFGRRLAWRIRIPMNLYPSPTPAEPNFGEGFEPWLAQGTWQKVDKETGEKTTVSIGRLSSASNPAEDNQRDQSFISHLSESEYGNGEKHYGWYEGRLTVESTGDPTGKGKGKGNRSEYPLPIEKVDQFIANNLWHHKYIHGIFTNTDEYDMLHPVLRKILDAGTWAKNCYILEQTEDYVDVVFSIKPYYAHQFARSMRRVYKSAAEHGVTLATLYYGDGHRNRIPSYGRKFWSSGNEGRPAGFTRRRKKKA